MKLPLSFAAIAVVWSTAALADAPRVAATIKPIHSLVAAVMGDLGTPELIVDGGASPHTYSLRPSDASALEQADIVFWTGHGMELFLEEALDSLAGNATVVELADSPGIELLPVREGGVFDAHVHDDAEDHDDHSHDHDDHDDAHDGDDHDVHDHDAHDHDEHDHDEHDHDGDHDEAHADEHAHDGGMDMHYWLDPVNAIHMLEQIAVSLGEADPDNAAAYLSNANAAIGGLQALEAELGAQLAPVRDAPFIVFHDAYQYFEHRFGLSIAGSITVTPDTMPGAARVVQIRERIASAGAACVFAEPQFEPAIVDTIIEGTEARAGTLDPEGGTLAEGPELYPTLIRNLAASLVECLER